MAKHRPASPFITSPRLRSAETVNRIASSNCRASAAADADETMHYRDSSLVAITCHASTSARLCVGETQRTVLSASNVTSEKVTLIDSTSARRAAAGIFL